MFGGGSTASGTGSFAHGSGCTSSDTYSIALGTGSSASATHAVARGYLCYASGSFSRSDGWTCSASNTFAYSYGAAGVANLYGQFAFGCSDASNQGYQQSMLQWRGKTTDGTQTEIFLNGSSNTRAVLRPGQVWTGHLDFQSIKTDQSKGVFGRKFFVIRRDGSNNTSLVGSVQTIVADILLGSNSYAISIDADDTNEALRVQVTGATSETVNWKCTAFFSEAPIG